MFDRIKIFCAPFLLVMFGILYAGSGAIAEDVAWHVSKSSGDFWVTASGVQQASLTEGAILKPGDNIRTGRNGRVLLVRGEETILISPNSVIGIPSEVKDGLSTTILQQAGSILLEVEKRNVKHFEVVTPYLAAVVKGTQFRVTVNKNNTSVGVLRGQVEVADFKSGQYALVLPGQAAKVSVHGPGGLSLSGTGALSPIQQGKPRTSSVNAVLVPKAGLSAPGSTPNTQQVRITSPLGDVKLDFQKVTKGLSHAPTVSTSSGRNGERTPDSRLSNADGKGNNNVNANGFGNGNGPGNGLGNGTGLNGLSNGNGPGNGNGNIANGFGNNGNGNGFGNNGNGNGSGVGPGNGLGNGHGDGHGKGKGKGKD